MTGDNKSDVEILVFGHCKGSDLVYDHHMFCAPREQQTFDT